MPPKRVDVNQPEIVDALRQAGWSVLPLHAVGKGCPDLLIGKPGINLLVEIKDGTKPPSRRELTDDQVKFHREWRGPIRIVSSVDEALQLL